MFGLIKKAFIALVGFSGPLVSMANVFNFTTLISLSNQPWMTKPSLNDLNAYEYNQGLYYYPYMVNLDRSNGSCNSLDVMIHLVKIFQTKQKI